MSMLAYARTQGWPSGWRGGFFGTTPDMLSQGLVWYSALGLLS
jgi:hypothetical protein